MSTSRIRQMLLVFAIIAAFAAFAITGYFSYREAERDTYAQLNDVATAWVENLAMVLETADTTLNQAAKASRGQPYAEVQKILRQLDYHNTVFRESGWIVDGTLVCTSNGLVDPPLRLDPAEGTLPPPGFSGIYLLPPRDSYIGGAALVINKRVDERTIVDTLIPPKALLTPLRYITRHRPISVFLVRGDGRLLLQSEQALSGAIVPGALPPVGSSQTTHGRVLTQQVQDFDAYVVAMISNDDFSAAWMNKLPVFGAIGLLASILFLTGALQLRSRYFGLRSELLEGIRKLQFQPYFQPVIDLATGECRGAEMLMRWTHPKRGLIPPMSFIMEAERTGLITAMTLAMVERESLEIRELLRRHPHLHLALNVSAPMLLENGFLERLAKAIGGKKYLRRLQFEITESVSVGETAAPRMAEYKQAGVELAVDDFGTGYSNLRYLQNFPFDYLKIDKAFVDGISTSTESSGLIDSIIAIGQKCSLSLIAEGIESQTQAIYLRRAGVQFGQGYFFGRPQPLAEFSAWLDQRLKSPSRKLAISS